MEPLMLGRMFADASGNGLCRGSPRDPPPPRPYHRHESRTYSTGTGLDRAPSASLGRVVGGSLSDFAKM
ncbi:hypothetical protein PG997_001390 [Apiospora hydei]|uniref:Uncharacterized protein n=1 Tax=Apiospora hydei TaxID=1337664 RepID=A0ABR1XDE4_9PEZI